MKTNENQIATQKYSIRIPKALKKMQYNTIEKRLLRAASNIQQTKAEMLASTPRRDLNDNTAY